jgi:CRP-like cAMP-binding protein
VSAMDAEVAIAGEVLRAQATRVKERFERLTALQRHLLRYTTACLTQVAQSSLCGLYHSVEQRLCRWLLTAQDRTRSDELLFTQDTLAGMIGARRPTVSIASGALQKRGLIRVNRGRVTVLDRAGIESAVCDCYWIIRQALGSFLEI